MAWNSLSDGRSGWLTVCDPISTPWRSKPRSILHVTKAGSLPETRSVITYDVACMPRLESVGIAFS